MSDTPRLYIADLAAYNAGHLHGIWIAATDELADIWTQVKSMLAESPVAGAEEFAVHDYEYFGSYQVNEYEGLESLHNIACFIEEFPDFAADLMAQFNDLDEARTCAEEHYCGCYTSLADYAQALTEETTEIPKHLALYIDYERMGRDMEINDVFTIETAYNEVHIFWNH